MAPGNPERRPVVVTGLGCVSPLGAGVAPTWDALLAGRSGVRSVRELEAGKLPVRFAAQAPRELVLEGVSAREARRLDRAMQLAMAAAEEAIRDADLGGGALDRDRVGVAIGTAIGGLGTLLRNHRAMLDGGPRRVSPFVVPMSLGNMPSGYVSMSSGFRGPNLSPSGACASGSQAIGLAARAIARGDADAMLAGGTEAVILPLVVAGFAAMRALSTLNGEPERASRPFDAGRDGFVLGEGAALLVLESRAHAEGRGAAVRAELLGYGEAADASHLASPAEDAAGARLAMRRALEDAGLEPACVDYVNAHATGTPVGDRVEAAALRAVFGEHAERLPVSSTKSMTGHLLGAAGGLEAAVCVRSLETGWLPPTVNLDQPDPECALDHVAHKARAARPRVALSNSFGFGGINASLVFGRRGDG